MADDALIVDDDALVARVLLAAAKAARAQESTAAAQEAAAADRERQAAEERCACHARKLVARRAAEGADAKLAEIEKVQQLAQRRAGVGVTLQVLIAGWFAGASAVHGLRTRHALWALCLRMCLLPPPPLRHFPGIVVAATLAIGCAVARLIIRPRARDRFLCVVSKEDEGPIGMSLSGDEHHLAEVVAVAPGSHAALARPPLAAGMLIVAINGEHVLGALGTAQRIANCPSGEMAVEVEGMLNVAQRAARRKRRTRRPPLWRCVLRVQTWRALAVAALVSSLALAAVEEERCGAGARLDGWDEASARLALGLPACGSSLESVTRAFRRQAVVYHPDKQHERAAPASGWAEWTLGLLVLREPEPGVLARWLSDVSWETCWEGARGLRRLLQRARRRWDASRGVPRRGSSSGSSADASSSSDSAGQFPEDGWVHYRRLREAYEHLQRVAAAESAAATGGATYDYGAGYAAYRWIEGRTRRWHRHLTRSWAPTRTHSR